MDNKEVHKLVRQSIGQFLKEYNFVKQGNNCWVRSTKEMIHMICLDFSYGQESFDFDIAVQPWCLPEEDVYLNISCRSKQLDERMAVPHWGSYEEDELLKDINDAKNVLKNKALPLLDNLSDSISLISCIEQKTFVVDPYKKSRIYTYIYFYKHKFKEAHNWLKEFYSLHSNFNNPKLIADRERLAGLAELSKRELYGEIDSYFDKLIGENAEKFKLKCLNIRP